MRRDSKIEAEGVGVFVSVFHDEGGSSSVPPSHSSLLDSVCDL